MEKFAAYFAGVPDPRAENARHDLLEVIFIALTALLCGAESCSDMADFGVAKADVLKQILKLEHGVPSHDTFSRVFRLIDPERFEAAFSGFATAFAGPLQGVVAIDGKALRGAYERGCKATPLHLVNVWAVEARAAVAQRLAPGRNEVAGALEAVALLDLSGCIVTADALHCRPDMAAAIRGQGGHYVLALKDNHPRLLASAKAALDTGHFDEAVTEPILSHGRIEHRRALVAVVHDLAEGRRFCDLVAVARVETHRRVNDQPEPAIVRHFLLSTPLPADRLLQVVRSHWTIENQLHWALDVTLDEDRARTRKDNAPQNLATLRKLALNILRRHPDKASLRRKIKRAGWDNAFLQDLIAQMR
jgi:predicted transposase YbfD/YdcC